MLTQGAALGSSCLTNLSPEGAIYLMPQSLAKILIHLVFSTKYRKPCLPDGVRSSLHAYISTVLKNQQCPVLAINSVEDHIHILFSLHRTVTLAKAVELAKKSSSRWLKEQSPEFSGFSWQAGYGAFSVSESIVPVVRRYIARQAEHHRKVSAKRELKAMLRKHSVEFDDRYLSD